MFSHCFCLVMGVARVFFPHQAIEAWTKVLQLEDGQQAGVPNAFTKAELLGFCFGKVYPPWN